MLKLKLQYFGHLMRRADSFERPWFWDRLRAGGEGDDRGWDGWMASPTQWTWVWVDSGSLWWTGRPGVLWFMGSQRVATELNYAVKYQEFLLVNLPVWELPDIVALENFPEVPRVRKIKRSTQHYLPSEYWSSTGRRFLQSFDSKGNEPSTTFHRFLSWPTYVLLFHWSHWQWKQTLCHPHQFYFQTWTPWCGRRERGKEARKEWGGKRQMMGSSF